jgi:hypothetical protein
MTDRSYLERRVTQETTLASIATNSRAKAAHDLMAAAYFRELERLAELEERQLCRW